ncbi:MAG: hypothetical protein AB7Y46_13435 [Armatimonadota bacterium]
MAALRAALMLDDDLRVEANARGENYWPLYAQEVLRRIGLPYEVIGPDRLSTDGLAGLSVLLLPPLGQGYLDGTQIEAICAWVEGGGLVVGFATEGLDDLFGVTVEDVINHAGDEFTPAACISLEDEAWTAQLLPAYERSTALPVIAPVRVIAAPQWRELARLRSFFEEDLKRPAITWREVGQGAACYWAFDLAQCLWKMQQGRPVYEDFDGDGKLRTMDMVTTRPWPGDVPYADLMSFVLRRVLAEAGAVFLHQLPPAPDGSIPDVLFHWGGDDEGATEVQIPAAEFMVEMGLPYHINIMQSPVGTHPFPREGFERLRELGCERSIHFNFITQVEHPHAFTKEELAHQLETYLAAYGEMPVCTVFHWVSWAGWAEPARWLAELGLRGDNNRIHWRYPPLNPVNKVAFAFGSAYPVHYWDDAAHANARIDFVSLPITAYEVGYLRGQGVEPSQLHRAIELGAFWNLTMSLFHHPIYLCEEPTRDAVRECLAHIQRLGLRALHMGTDQACLWWHARDTSAIESVERDGETLVARVRSEWEHGCVLQMLAPAGDVTAAVNNRPAQCLVRDQHGARWLYVAVPAGESTLRVCPG